ncbi:uncharacterized protein [Epargyreus clarus]|uniref:uncharacterized protein n=1 Tax=Epargyreus clarus TaxID=520877 RepID=UPI003C2C6D30
MLESFRDVVINGNDDVPPLDPLVINHLGPFVYTYTGVRMTANVRNFRMEGLRWYVVNDVRFDLLRLTTRIGMTVPWLVLTGAYDATAVIGFISHRSGGNFRIFINRVDVDVNARLGTNILGGHLLLRELNINLDVHDVQIQIHGLTGSSVLNNLINALVQSVTRDFINNEMENVSQMISEALFDVINEFLKDFTLDDLRISN